ncbi:MAG: aldo/keto reductase [Polyangiaceae bacterium]
MQNELAGGGVFAPSFASRPLGSTGLRVGPIALGSSYGVGGADLEHAFDRGSNFFLWGSRRRSGFRDGLKEIVKKNRQGAVIAIQSYTRVGMLMGPFVHQALRQLGTDYVDMLGLAWWNDLPSHRILDAALELKAQGKVRHIMVSCHHRPSFEKFLRDPNYGAWMLRYNAAHTGAEKEVFPHLDANSAESDFRPGVLAFTATRWGSLLDPRATPVGEKTPRASDCYRFALSNPHIDAVIAGPRDRAELDEALASIERGPMSADELAWMRRVGQSIRDRDTRGRTMSIIDRISGLCRSSTKQLSA